MNLILDYEVISLKFRQRTLENKTRHDIYNFILKYPGLHFSELSRKLDLPKSTLLFHLNYLERCGVIVTKTEGRYTRFFVEKSFGSFERKIINILRQDALRNIVLYIGILGGASQVELSRELSLSPKTIEKHLKRLMKVGFIEPAIVGKGLVYTELEGGRVIERNRVGKEVIYVLSRKPNSDVNIGSLISGLPVIHETDFTDGGTTKNLLDYMYSMQKTYPDWKSEKKIVYFGISIKRMEKVLLDVFPLFFRA